MPGIPLDPAGGGEMGFAILSGHEGFSARGRNILLRWLMSGSGVLVCII